MYNPTEFLNLFDAITASWYNGTQYDNCKNVAILLDLNINTRLAQLQVANGITHHLPVDVNEGITKIIKHDHLRVKFQHLVSVVQYYLVIVCKQIVKVVEQSNNTTFIQKVDEKRGS